MKQQSKRLLLPLAAALRVIMTMAFLTALPGFAKVQDAGNLNVSQLEDKDIKLEYKTDGWYYSWEGEAEAKFNGTLTGTATITKSFKITSSDMNGAATLDLVGANIKGETQSIPLFYCDHPKNTTLTIKINNSTLKASSVFDTSLHNGPVIIKAEGVHACVIDGGISLTDDALTVDGGTEKGLTVNGAIMAAGEGSTNPNIKLSGKIKVNDYVHLLNKCVFTVGESVQVATSKAVITAFHIIKPDSVTYNSPILQWTYDLPLEAGTLTIKKEGTDLATFPTDGNLKSFGIGGIAGQTYTVWYTPDDGKPEQQSDAKGNSEFKLDGSRLQSNTGMQTKVKDAPLNLGSLGSQLASVSLKYKTNEWYYSWEGQAETKFNGTLTGAATITNGFTITSSDMNGAATLDLVGANIKGETQGIPLFNCKHSEGLTLSILLKNSTLTAAPVFDVPLDNCGPVIIRAEGTDTCTINGDLSFSLIRNALTVDGGTGGGLTVNGLIKVAEKDSPNPNIKLTGKIKVNGYVYLLNKCVFTVGESVQVATDGNAAFSINKDYPATYNSPILQWTYDLPLEAGTLTIKKEGTDLATFPTDGKRRSFGIGGIAGQTYTVWYTPDGGKPEQQSDAKDNSKFKLDKPGFLSSTGMKAKVKNPITPDASDTNITITGDSTYQEGTGGTTDFNNSIGNGTAPLTIGRLTFATTDTVSITAKKLTINGPIYVNSGAQAILAFEGENQCRGVYVSNGGNLTFKKQDGIANTITSHNPITNYGMFADETGQISEVYILATQPLTLDRSASSAPIEHVQPGSKITLKVSATLGVGTATTIEYQWFRWNATGEYWEPVQEPGKTRSSEAAQPSAPAYGQSPTLEVSAADAGAYRCTVICNVSPTQRTVLTSYTTVEVKTPEPTPPPYIPTYYSITLPSVEGAVTNPQAGEYSREEGYSFSFSLMLEEGYKHSVPVVTANGVVLTARASDGKYIIKSIMADTQIKIDGVVRDNPTGNAEIENDTIRVRGSVGALLISTPHPSSLEIYTISSNRLRHLNISAGDSQIQLPAGLYIIQVGDHRQKVFIR